MIYQTDFEYFESIFNDFASTHPTEIKRVTRLCLLHKIHSWEACVWI